MLNNQKTKAYFLQLDAADPLSGERKKYKLPDNVTYFVGNSLGAMPLASRDKILHTVESEWANGLVDSWNNAQWISLPQRLGAKIAPLIGASDDEVIVADSTSINLFKIIVASLQLQPDRKTIITESSSFPTDLYIMQGIRDLLPERVQLKTIARQEIASALDDDTALVVLSHVDYRTGELLDMHQYTTLAHDAGALMLWDLCHSAGVVDVKLREANADFAVGCGYKFLNGGPGAPSYVYVAKQWIDKIEQPLTGWMGHDMPFEFSLDYQPANSINRMLTGTHPVLGAISLEGAIDSLLGLDVSAIRKKSMLLSQLMIEFMDEQECEKFGFELISPRQASQRGSQVSYQHEYGYAIIQALIARGVMGDYRNPAVLRFGLAPVYQRYIDIWTLVTAIVDIMEAESWKAFKDKKKLAVT